MLWVKAHVIDAIFPLLADYFSVDLDKFALKYRIDREQYALPNNKVPFKDAIALLEAAAQETKCSYFGALLASHQTRDHVGLPALAGEYCDTLQDSIPAMFSHVGLNSNAVSWQFVREQKYCYLIAHFTEKANSTQATLLTMVHVYNILRRVSNNQWRPLQTNFTFPPLPNTSNLKRFFGPDLSFNMDYNGFIFDQEQLQIPLATSDKHADTIISEYIKLTGKASSVDKVENSRRAIRSNLLLKQQCRLADVANTLNVSPRAVQYYLHNKGLTYQQLLDEVRYQLACELLATSEQSISAISSLVGFADTAVFARSFKKYMNQTPSQYRKEHR